MGFSDCELRYIENIFGRLCKRRSPSRLRDQSRAVYVVGGEDVTIYEERLRWDNPQEWTNFGVAKFTYNRKQNVWKLYWMRSDLKWHLYELLPESTRIDRLVTEVDKDPHGAFFG